VRAALLGPLARIWPRSPRLPRPLRLSTILANLAVGGDRAFYQDRRHLPLWLSDKLYGPDLKARRFDPFAALEPHLARAPKEPLARSLYLDLKTWLADDGLVKVDRMSMAHALEVRCPLLDHRVIELAARVPSSLKLRGGRTKILLRRVAERRLPALAADILARPKRGFAPPVSRWLREDLRDLSRDLLLAPDALARDLFEIREVSRLLEDHRTQRLDAGWSLWTLLMLEVWNREVLHGARQPIPEEMAHAAAL
jgi:asparagine synthase (glutamine-hydrolysing)